MWWIPKVHMVFFPGKKPHKSGQNKKMCTIIVNLVVSVIFCCITILCGTCQYEETASHWEFTNTLHWLQVGNSNCCCSEKPNQIFVDIFDTCSQSQAWTQILGGSILAPPHAKHQQQQASLGKGNNNVICVWGHVYS